MEGDGQTGKNPVLEMMARRDRERKLLIEKNQKARQNKSEKEGVEYFEGIFDTKICELENKLSCMEPSSDLVKLQEEFNKIGEEIQDLQKYFTSSTIFLSDHKIKTSQDVINQLVTKCEETKSRLLPKKKFGFKNKTTKTNNITNIPEDVKEIPKESARKEFLWTDSQKTHQILKYSDDKVNNQDLTFKDMENCVILIHGHAGSLQMLNIKNCIVLCGPVSRSVFADNCLNCTFAFSCQQLRLHSSSFCDIYILVTSRAIIEDCHDVNFAPYSYSYENYESDLKHSGLDVSTNNWKDVGDFNYLSSEKSPNWNEIEEAKRISDWSCVIDDFCNTHKCL